jgi:hypothetical protein
VPRGGDQFHQRGELTSAECSCIIDGVSTSLGEASAWTQATDPERRETPRVRTAPPGLRVEPKWLPVLHFCLGPDTPCSAETLTSGVRFPGFDRVLYLCLRVNCAGWPHVLRPRGGEDKWVPVPVRVDIPAPFRPDPARGASLSAEPLRLTQHVASSDEWSSRTCSTPFRTDIESCCAVRLST